MKISKTTNHGAIRWRLTFSVAGKQYRRFFESKSVAETFARSQEAEQRSRGDDWVSLSVTQRMAAVAAIQRSEAGGYSLGEALDHWERSAAIRTVQKVLLSQAITECLAAKRARGLRPRSIAQLKYSLDGLARANASSWAISDIIAQDIEKHLANRLWSASRKRSVLTDLSTLFSWCVKRGYLERSPTESIERPIIDNQRPEIFSPDASDALLRLVREKDPGLLPHFALGLFAGLRSAEIARIGWESIHLDRGLIEVEVETSKTRARRLVTIQPNLRAWLAIGGELDRKGGFNHPTASTNQRRRIPRILEALGYNRDRPWPRNAARHSFVSYHLAMWSDAGKTALEAGHSVEILFRHYRELVTRQDAERYWAILPQ